MTRDEILAKLRAAAATRGATVTIEERLHVRVAAGGETVYAIAGDSLRILAKLDAKGQSVFATTAIDAAIKDMGAVIPVPPPPVPPPSPPSPPPVPPPAPPPVVPPVTPPPPPITKAMRVGTNFWNLGWGIWDDVFVPTAEFSGASTPWQPQFLAEVARYTGPLRMMDFGCTNDSPQKAWTDRNPRNSTRQAIMDRGLPYEWMIDLCNRLGKDMWVCVPHQATDDYAKQLAVLIQAQLRPELRCYVEWSNETWNGGFAALNYCLAEGKKLKLDTDEWSNAFRFTVVAACRVFAQFEAVFGKNSARLVKVIAGQDDNTWLTGLHLESLARPAINPTGVTIDAYAIAPYFGHDVDGNAANAVDGLRAAMRAVTDNVKQQFDITSKAGLRLVAYEGGQHVYQAGANAVNARPELYAIYSEHLAAVAPYFTDFVHYLHNGQWNGTGAWGAEQRVGDPLTTSHKLRALMDWIAAN